MTPEERMNKLCTDVEVVKSKLENFIRYIEEDICKVNDDHEIRLRSLESFKSKFIGAIILGNVLTGIIVAVIVGFLSRG